MNLFFEFTFIFKRFVIIKNYFKKRNLSSFYFRNKILLRNEKPYLY